MNEWADWHRIKWTAATSLQWREESLNGKHKNCRLCQAGRGNIRQAASPPEPPTAHPPSRRRTNNSGRACSDTVLGRIRLSGGGRWASSDRFASERNTNQPRFIQHTLARGGWVYATSPRQEALSVHSIRFRDRRKRRLREGSGDAE